MNVSRMLAEDPELETLYERFLPAFGALLRHIDCQGHAEDFYDDLVCCAFIFYNRYYVEYDRRN